MIGTVLVAAVVLGCVSAALWQLRRLDERRATNAQVRARAGEVVALPDAGFRADPAADDLIYRRVRVRGTYDADAEVLARFRSRKGLPGYNVLTPLRTAQGVVVVNRGWVPLDVGDRWPDRQAAAPDGEVEVEGMLVEAESGPLQLTGGDGEEVPVVAAIDPRRLATTMGADARDVYALLLLAAASGDAFPAPIEPPDLGEGPHRDYAVQWFLFAAVGVVGWIVLLFRRGPFSRRAGLQGPGRAPRPS